MPAAQAGRAQQREEYATSAPRVVSAWRLFQTPEPLAGLFDRFGRILEPSAGLGRLYRAIRRRAPDAPVVLVDRAPECCRELYLATAADPAAQLVQADFLACDAERLGGLFDVVIANPPFARGEDIRHLLHARRLLAPGGRLAAICANGPRQRAALGPLASAWYDLPAGSFQSEGTSVNAAIVVVDA